MSGFMGVKQEVDDVKMLRHNVQVEQKQGDLWVLNKKLWVGGCDLIKCLCFTRAKIENPYEVVKIHHLPPNPPIGSSKNA